MTHWPPIPGLILLLLVWLCIATAQAGDFDASKLQGLGDTRYQQFNSENLGHPLHLYVRVPESAKGNPQRRYPTVYLLDGGITYPLLSAYYHYLQLGKEVPELREAALRFIEHWSSPGQVRPFDLTVHEPAGGTHMSSVTDAFRQGLLWLFPAD